MRLYTYDEISMGLGIGHDWKRQRFYPLIPKKREGQSMKDTSMKITLIAAMLAMFAATASAETPATTLASNDSLLKQLAHRECKYLLQYRIATSALNAEPKGPDLKSLCVNPCDERRGGAYTGGRHTLILGVGY